MYDNDSITLRFKVDVNGCMFCNSGLEHQHQWDLPWGKNVINLNNFDLLWLFFSAHLQFMCKCAKYLYKMNLDFLCLNSQIVIFAQPVLLFAVYVWLANICHFLYICSIKFFRGKKKKKYFLTPPPPLQWFSPLYSVNLPSLQNTGSGSRYTYGINFKILGDFLHTSDFLITFTIFWENLRLTLSFQVTEESMSLKIF